MTQDTKKPNISLSTKIITAIIVIAPVFQHYRGISKLLVPEIMYILIFLFCLLNLKSVALFKYRYLFIYLVYTLIASFLFGIIFADFSLTQFLTSYTRYLFYIVVVILVSRQYFNISYGAKVYVFVTVINSIYLIAQFLAYKFLNITLPWHIKGVPLLTGTKLISQQEYIFQMLGYRPQGFFLEPAFFSHYVIPGLLILLFFKSDSFNLKKPTRIIASLITIIALLLSGSGTGLVLLGFTVFFWLLEFLKSTRGKNYIPKLFIAFLFLTILFVVLSQTSIITPAISRISSLTDTSAMYARVLNGLEDFSGLPILRKFIGVGFGNHADFILGQNSYDATGYYSTISSVLIDSGIIGLLLYLLFYIDVIRNTTGFYRYWTVILLVSTTSSLNPLSLSIVTSLAFIMKGYRQNRS